MYIIYRLDDPRVHQTRYVGITDNVFARFIQHVQCLGGNQAKNAWIQELRKENVMPLMIELERTPDRVQALLRETYWICHYHTLNHPLLNIVKTVERLPSRVVSIPRQKHGSVKAPITDEEAQAALIAWNNGATSQRTLRDALNVTEHRARQLRQYLIDHVFVDIKQA
jgi:predicted GIY-YIG superfamily endonuclease